MILFVLLGIMIAFFTFTLGIHLGKRVATRSMQDIQAGSHASVPTLPDEIPGRVELTEQGKGIDSVADEELNQSLHKEVAKTGVKLDAARQVELPEETAHEGKPAAATSPGKEETLPALDRPIPHGSFTIQVGSYETLADTQPTLTSLEALKLGPFVRSVYLENIGRRYRVYVGGYATPEGATDAAKRYVKRQIIKDYVVAKMPQN